MNLELIQKEFNAQIIECENSFDKIRIEKNRLTDVLSFLKNNALFSIDRLNTIISTDLGVEENKFELIYDLFSTSTYQTWRISVFLDRNAPRINSVTKIFKSAYFDECEIYDMFGIIFDDNPNLKRLLMPKGWIGYPLRKDYNQQQDERLAWAKKDSNKEVDN